MILRKIFKTLGVFCVVYLCITSIQFFYHGVDQSNIAFNIIRGVIISILTAICGWLIINLIHDVQRGGFAMIFNKIKNFFYDSD